MNISVLYKAIVKSMIARYVVYAANLVSMMILARIFAPQIYGTVAAIQVFLLFFQLIAEAGLGPAVINIDKLEKIDRNGIFGLTLLLGLTLSLIFYLLSPVFLHFYQIARVNEVVPFIAVSLFFSSVSVLPLALLQREQAFFREANAGVAAEVVSTSFAIIFINWFDPLYVLSAKSSMIALTSFLVYYYFSGKTEFGRPKFGTKISAIKPLLSFSLYQFGFNLVVYFSRHLDNILVGRVLGSGVLGIYDKAYQIMRYPSMLLTFAMTPAIQPVVRKYSHDISKVEEIHRQFTFKLSLVSAVSGLVIFILADWVVLILLGKQWHEVVPIIQVLAINIPAQVINATHGSFFQALKKVNLLFYSGCIAATVTIFCIVFGVYQKNLIMLAWAIVVAFYINFIQIHFVLYFFIFKKNTIKFFLGMFPLFFVVICMILWKTEGFYWIKENLLFIEFIENIMNFFE